MIADIIPMKETMRVRVRRALDGFKGAQDNWKEHALALAIELRAARLECGNNNKFGIWLAENDCDDLARNDRQALVNIGEYIDLAREVFSTTSRTSLQHIWLKELQPMTLHQVMYSPPIILIPAPVVASVPAEPSITLPIAEPILPSIEPDTKSVAVAVGAGYRIIVSDGRLISEAARSGIELLEQGVSTTDVPAKIGLSLHTFTAMRDIVLLSQRNDLTTKDAEIVRQALIDVDRTRFIHEPWERVKPIADRVWGTKGHRLKTDKKRAEQFETVMHLISTTCANAVKITIPYINQERADEAIKTLKEAELALHQLKQRITEETAK